MTPEEMLLLQQELDRLGPAASFPWHTQQEYALRAATDIVSVNGGNQSGKSKSGLGAVSRLVRREGPVYQRLRNPVGRKLKIWVAPKTDEKFKSVWEPRLLDFVFAGFEQVFGSTKLQPGQFKYRQHPHPIFEWMDDQGGGEVWGKAQKQGFMAFESDAVDLCVFDEEPEDPRLLTSAKARFSTTNGVLMLCFTPLLGMSFTYHQYYRPTVKDRFRIADRVWRRGNEITIVEMGMADNPEAVAGGGVARFMNDPSMSAAEKDSRLYGRYGYTEGLLIPAFADLGTKDEDPYILEYLPSSRSYNYILTADPNKRHGGLLTAFDDAGNRYYLQEHYATNLPDSHHAKAYLAILSLWKLSMSDVMCYADPGGAGAQAILNLAEGGVFAQPIRKDPGSVAASIKRLRGAAFIDPTHRHPVTGKLGAPRVYFIAYNERTGRGLRSTWKEGESDFQESRLCFELRQYRQKRSESGEAVAPDTPVKENDDVVDPARYAELARMALPETKDEDETKLAREQLDPLSRQEAESFDKMAQKAEAGFAALQARLGRQIERDYRDPNMAA